MPDSCAEVPVNRAALPMQLMSLSWTGLLDLLRNSPLAHLELSPDIFFFLRIKLPLESWDVFFYT